MNKIRPQSDHIIEWSDYLERRTYHITSKTAQSLAQGSAASRCRPAGLPDQAFQTLRQAQLQVRPRTRSRTQVLLVGQSLKCTAVHGVRPAGAVRQSVRVSGQLSPTARDPRGDLRHQPRVAETQGGVLRDGREGRHGQPLDRPSGRRRPHRKHAGRLVVRRGFSTTLYGGARS